MVRLTRQTWESMPQEMKSKLVSSLHEAERTALSNTSGPQANIATLRAAARKLVPNVRKVVDHIEDIVSSKLSEQIKKGMDPQLSEAWIEHAVNQLEKRVFQSLALRTPVGKLVLDPVGPERFLYKKPNVFLSFRPESFGIRGQALPESNIYVFFASAEELNALASGKGNEEAWRQFVVESAAHELTHFVQMAFYPEAIGEHIQVEKGVESYRKQPAEREARESSMDAMLRLYGPTSAFKKSMSNIFFPNELAEARQQADMLISTYRNRILNMSGSMMTADAIAKKLGLTEKAMRAFMETMTPFEGQLETVEQSASDAHKHVLMLVAPNEFYETEYSIPRKVFSERGMDVSVATSGTKAVGAQGTTIEIDIEIKDVKPTKFDGLFVVGGKGMIGFSDDLIAQQLLRDFVESEKPVALICHAPLLAAKANLVKGRQITGWSEIRPDMLEAGAEWTGMPVERDGDLFTAVGPDDAESLADILARRLDGAPTLSEAMLDENAAMRKLAALWKLADQVGGGRMSDEEVARRLLEFERQEFEEDDEKEIPQAPVPPPVLPVEKSTPDLWTKVHRKQESNEWNLSVELNPPSTNGTWVEVTATPPGFPFDAEDLSDGASIRRLFQKRETWEALKEMVSNPAKKGMIQEFILPKIVLAVGKRWWDINKRRRSVGDAPFGLLTSEEYKKIRNEDLDGTDVGRAFIALVNWHVAKILQFYLATKTPAGSLDGYIYDALNRRMMADAGKRQGFSANRKPVCSYCRNRRDIKTAPPILSQTSIHETQEEGLSRRHPKFKCPTCAEILDTKEKELRIKEMGVANANQTLDETKAKKTEAEKELALDPSNRELKARIVSLSDTLRSDGYQVEALEAERNTLRVEISNRRRMLDIPSQHMSCINENCPGQRIPLTFVDWESPFWQTAEGNEARRKLASVYGIVENPQGQKAEDGGKEGAVSETAARTPPKWLWDVPFHCPFDDAKFTPRQAFGKGKMDPGGSHMGGLFIDPPRTTRWEQPASFEPADPETAKNRVEDTKQQTGIEQTTGTNEFLNDQNEKLYYMELSSSLRQEFYRRKLEHAERTGGIKGNRTSRLQSLLYDAVLEWSYIHPLHLVGFFTKRMPVLRKVIDKKTGEIKDHLEVRSMPRNGADQIVSSIIQTWFSKVLQQENGFVDLRPYLTNIDQDRVPPRCYFLSVVKRSGDVLFAECGLHYGENSPLGKRTMRAEEGKSSSYDKQSKNLYLALVEGIWDFSGTPNNIQMMTPILPEDGQKLAQGKASHLDEMDTHDKSRIIFDSSTTLTEGSPVLVKALMMPSHTGWRPKQRILDLRKDLPDKEDEMAGVMGAIGRLADNKENDVKLFSIWRKTLRRLGMPEQLEEFDKILKKRLEEGK